MAGRRCEFRAAAGKGRDGKGAERSGAEGGGTRRRSRPRQRSRPAARPLKVPPAPGDSGEGLGALLPSLPSLVPAVRRRRRGDDRRSRRARISAPGALSEAALPRTLWGRRRWRCSVPALCTGRAPRPYGRQRDGTAGPGTSGLDRWPDTSGRPTPCPQKGGRGRPALAKPWRSCLVLL